MIWPLVAFGTFLLACRAAWWLGDAFARLKLAFGRQLINWVFAAL